ALGRSFARRSATRYHDSENVGLTWAIVSGPLSVVRGQLQSLLLQRTTDNGQRTFFLNPKFESEPIGKPMRPDPNQPAVLDVHARLAGQSGMHPRLGLGNVGVHLEYVLAFLGHAQRYDAVDFEVVILVGKAGR